MSQSPHPDLNAERPWLAEKEVGSELARQLIASQFPELEPLSLSHLGTGWDNVVYLVNQTFVFRFPRRSMALDLMDTEWKLLDRLAPELPLQIPRPLFKGQASESFDWPFAGYSLVPGRTACAADLTPEQRAVTCQPLAECLKTLHGFDLQVARSLDLPGDTLAKVDIVQRLPKTLSRLETAVSLGLIRDPQPYHDFIAALPAVTPAPRPLALVHGDLYVRHLVVDAGGRLTGVIDWGDAHLGDSATDLSIVYSFLPPQAHASFWQAYGPVSEDTRLLACFRALFHNLALLLYAEDTHDADLKRESARTLAFLAEGWQSSQ
ncbi:MAG: phosphotransferase [Candidatus Sericytochromatia bacterium]